MIVVDTSVWLAAARQRLVAEGLKALIEADEIALAVPVRLELLVGTPKHRRAQFHVIHDALPQVYPTDETWALLREWIERATDAGETFGLTDLMIASIATEIGGLVWSLDKDFERMEKLGFVSLYDPPDAV